MKFLMTFLLLIVFAQSSFSNKLYFEFNDSVLSHGCEDMLSGNDTINSGYVVGYISGVTDETLRRMSIYGMMTLKGPSVRNVCQDFIVLENQEQYEKLKKLNLFNHIIRKRVAYRNGYTIKQLNKIDNKLKEKLKRNK